MTREVVARIKEQYPAVMEHIETLRKEHKNLNTPSHYAYEYTLGLRDAGLITERERQILFVYTTIKFERKNA